MVNITMLSVQWALLSLFYLFKLIAFSQQQNEILSMKTWDLQSLNNILIVIYFVCGGCKIQIQIWMQSQLLWMDWPLICAASGVHRIFPDSWTLRRSCPRWLMPSCCSQLKFLACQQLVSLLQKFWKVPAIPLLNGSYSPLDPWAPSNCP